LQTGIIRITLLAVIVCICHRVSDRDIARAATSGCPDFETLQDDLRVATACGACHGHAREAFAEHAARLCGTCPGAQACGAVPVRLGPGLALA
jgi:bacterioferritin-associated ferredoxin